MDKVFYFLFLAQIYAYGSCLYCTRDSHCTLLPLIFSCVLITFTESIVFNSWHFGSVTFCIHSIPSLFPLQWSLRKSEKRRFLARMAFLYKSASQPPPHPMSANISWFIGRSMSCLSYTISYASVWSFSLHSIYNANWIPCSLFLCKSKFIPLHITRQAFEAYSSSILHKIQSDIFACFCPAHIRNLS